MKEKPSLLSGIDMEAMRAALQQPLQKDAAELVALRLPLEHIEPDPNQPRRSMDAGEDGQSLEELAQSILEHGVLQPINVESIGNGRYRILSGERRWRAACIARDSGMPCVRKGYDLHRIPAVVMATEEGPRKLEMQLIENLAREDMRDEDIAAALQNLMDAQGINKSEVARRIGRDRAWVTRILSKCSPEGLAMAKRIGVPLSQIGPYELNTLLSWQGTEKDGWIDEIAESIAGGMVFSRTLLDRVSAPTEGSETSGTGAPGDEESEAGELATEPGVANGGGVGNTGAAALGAAARDEDQQPGGDNHPQPVPQPEPEPVQGEPSNNAGYEEKPVQEPMQETVQARAADSAPTMPAEDPEWGGDDEEDREEFPDEAGEESQSSDQTGGQPAERATAKPTFLTVHIPYALAEALLQRAGKEGEVTAELLLEALESF